MNTDILDTLVTRTRDAIVASDADAVVEAFEQIVNQDALTSWQDDYRSAVLMQLGSEDAVLGLKFLTSWQNEATLRYLNAFVQANYGEDLQYGDA